MGMSLRIDVDNPFGYQNMYRKILNRISLDYNLIPHWSRLGFLDNAKRLRDYLQENAVSATWFFRNITAPKKEDIDGFTMGSFDIALHAERTDTLEHFSEEVNRWTNSFGFKPRGFSKHGSGDQKLSRQHVMEYNDENFLNLGANIGLEYFCGNGTDYRQTFRIREGLVFVPAVLWLDNLALHGSETVLEEAIDFSKDNPLIVLLHPIRWAMQTEVRELLEHLIRQVDFKPLISQINAFKESKNEA
jgi:peptidoglycan/xylan/chitin deacetylase (PgdA/CDA1 family)